jgi:hypothetical protein
MDAIWVLVGTWMMRVLVLMPLGNVKHRLENGALHVQSFFGVMCNVS